MNDEIRTDGRSGLARRRNEDDLFARVCLMIGSFGAGFLTAMLCMTAALGN